MLEFEEGPEFMSLLLSVCYSGTDGLSSADLDTLAQLILAVRKYEMPLIAAGTQSAWDLRAASSPMEAYIVAVKYGLRDHARAAAAKVSERPMSNWPYVRAMETTPALAYHRLMEFYDCCTRTVESCFVQAADGILKQDRGSPTKENAYSCDATTSVAAAVRELNCGQGMQGPGADLDHYVQDIITDSEYTRRMKDRHVNSVVSIILEGSFDLPKRVKAALGNVQIEVD
ncbi:hypothetical protein OH77DRAFT_1102382 [Trametes cingulata]|nr:hypothetical protein OH77DRAFT_1102382 [Trametes cingulata]